MNWLDYAAVLAGYAASIGLWYGVTRAWPVLWVQGQEISFQRPRVELGLAFLAALGVFVLNIAYHQKLLPSFSGLGRTAGFWLVLAIIWSPVFAVLVWRQQGPDTCLMSHRGILVRLAWGAVAAAVGVLAYLVVETQGTGMAKFASVLQGWKLSALLQSLLQFFGFGFLLARLAAAIGWRRGSLVVGALYGAVKYPYYLSTLGMSFAQATVVIVFSGLVAGLSVYFILDRRDITVPAIAHVFMDYVQRV